LGGIKMANSIDISAKLKKEPIKIKLTEDKEYEVDNSAETFVIVQDKLKDKEFSIDVMYEVIEILMGKDALKEIKDMKLSVNGIESVIIGLMAAINEISYEEMEKRFPKQ
jgi:hypothetical protein